MHQDYQNHSYSCCDIPITGYDKQLGWVKTEAKLNSVYTEVPPSLKGQEVSLVAKEGHYSHGYLGYGKNKAELTVHWEPEMLLSLLWATSFIQNQMLYI
ncbi:hypothetical protein Anapl_10572 [Anas platyrhynchos]|uniref:Uncharacterized protein n=1 Tax=Anas platyrhynchos TaxID=8839 RepID=R0KG21_ANAPL|nr:hypothetical protein Anapl_10572 [Anas platyrhynchos]